MASYWPTVHEAKARLESSTPHSYENSRIPRVLCSIIVPPRGAATTFFVPLCNKATLHVSRLYIRKNNTSPQIAQSRYCGIYPHEMSAEPYLPKNPICSKSFDALTNADMDGIAVAVASEPGLTAGTSWIQTRTSNVRCRSEHLFAWVSALF